MLAHPDPKHSTTPLTEPGGITVHVATLTTDSHMSRLERINSRYHYGSCTFSRSGDSDY